nr:MAG TPA: hypothetical protein [Bacteriophage sp.]
MEIKRETTVMVLTTDGKEIHKGDDVVFNASGRCYAGYFGGISKKGALMFKSVIYGTDVTFHVMPKCIETIYKASIKLSAESEEKNEI